MLKNIIALVIALHIHDKKNRRSILLLNLNHLNTHHYDADDTNDVIRYIILVKVSFINFTRLCANHLHNMKMDEGLDK